MARAPYLYTVPPPKWSLAVAASNQTAATSVTATGSLKEQSSSKDPSGTAPASEWKASCNCLHANVAAY